MPSLSKPSNLIATLGTEAQVVITTYHLLHAWDPALDDVLVLHTDPRQPAIGAAVQALRRAFEALPAQLHLQEIRDAHRLPVPDVISPAQVEAAFRALFRAVAEAKRRGERVHLSIAGGRKSLAVLGPVVAQLLFDREDRLWHLYSDPAFIASRRTLPGPEDRVELIPIPVVHLASTPEEAADLAGAQDPYEALERLQIGRLRRRVLLAHRFLNQILTPAERAVAELAAFEGLSDEQIANRLHLSRKTVGHHLGSVYAKARETFDTERMNRQLLAGWLAPYRDPLPDGLNLPPSE